MEAAARDARYAAFRQLADQCGVQAVLLAHHRNDQAETVLLRLLRGAGPTGLAAMAPVMQRQGLTYLRPWLGVDRERILSAARDYTRLTGWEPVHDPTNRDDKYTRAAVRERLVRSEEHTSELQSLMRNSYAVFGLKKQKNTLVSVNTL